MEPLELNLEKWNSWIESRPEIIQAMCRSHPPDRYYKMKDTGQIVTLLSYSENRTITVDVSADYNFVVFERQVFGVDPDNLEACDPPNTQEPAGCLFSSEDEIKQFINSVKKINEKISSQQ